MGADIWSLLPTYYIPFDASDKSVEYKGNNTVDFISSS